MEELDVLDELLSCDPCAPPEVGVVGTFGDLYAGGGERRLRTGLGLESVLGLSPKLVVVREAIRTVP